MHHFVQIWCMRGRSTGRLMLEQAVDFFMARGLRRFHGSGQTFFDKC